MKRSAFAIAASSAALWLGQGMAQAEPLSLQFPGIADITAQRSIGSTSYLLPIGPFANGSIATEPTEGALDQSAWRIAEPGMTTMQLLQPLREQVKTAGFTVLYECAAVECGGFDFRFATDVLPEPDMHVDLGDYRYLAAVRSGPEGPEYISLIVSRAADVGFVQMTRVGPQAVVGPVVTFAPRLSEPGPTISAEPQPAVKTGVQPAVQPVVQTGAPGGSLIARLTTGGAQPLDDLIFASGKAALEDGDYASLAELAGWLKANPAATITLVGHTDASGGLDANIALSRKRAESVRQRLLAAFDVPAGQVLAQGVGSLAPRDSNQTPEGQTRNRRVEVMLTSTP